MTVIIGKFLLIILISYLIGAIPFGKIVAKRMGKVDITEHGSGNIGSTNVLRTIGTKAGLLVLFLDVLKGFTAVMLSRVIIGDGVIMTGPYPVRLEDVGHVVAAMTVMAGHNWSVYIKFHGGKGVAAYFGGWLAMDPIAVAFGVIILVCVVAITRHMSRGSILAALGILILQMLLIIFHDTPPVYLLYSLLAAIVIIVQHRRNIQRLRQGTELKIDLGEKVKKLDS
jgi:glycerol-3-phosphate acyltransferase PlsY